MIMPENLQRIPHKKALTLTHVLGKWVGLIAIGVCAAILGYFAGSEYRTKYRGQQIFDFLDIHKYTQSR